MEDKLCQSARLVCKCNNDMQKCITRLGNDLWRKFLRAEVMPVLRMYLNEYEYEYGETVNDESSNPTYCTYVETKIYGFLFQIYRGMKLGFRARAKSSTVSPLSADLFKDPRVFL